MDYVVVTHICQGNRVSSKGTIPCISLAHANHVKDVLHMKQHDETTETLRAIVCVYIRFQFGNVLVPVVDLEDAAERLKHDQIGKR